MSRTKDGRRAGRKAVLDPRDLDQAIPDDSRNLTCDGETRIEVASTVLDPGLVQIAQESMEDNLT